MVELFVKVLNLYLIVNVSSCNITYFTRHTFDALEEQFKK